MIVGGIKKVPYKFFVHNIGIDFFLAVRDEKSRIIERVILNQLKTAEALIKIFNNQTSVKSYESRILLE